jgi:hypothetical protein
MAEVSTILLGVAALAALVVLIEGRVLKAIRLGRAIVGEFGLKKSL